MTGWLVYTVHIILKCIIVNAVTGFGSNKTHAYMNWMFGNFPMIGTILSVSLLFTTPHHSFSLSLSLHCYVRLHYFTTHCHYRFETNYSEHRTLFPFNSNVNCNFGFQPVNANYIRYMSANEAEFVYESIHVARMFFHMFFSFCLQCIGRMGTSMSVRVYISQTRVMTDTSFVCCPLFSIKCVRACVCAFVWLLFFSSLC